MKLWGQWWEEIYRADLPEESQAVVGTVWSPRATRGLKLPSLGLQGEKVWAEGQRDGILLGHLGPGGRILFYALCPTKNYWGNRKRKGAFECMCKGGTRSGLTLSHTLCLSLWFSYLKEAPIFVQWCFSPKAVNKSTKLIAAVVLSVLWTEHWIWLMGLCQAGIPPGQ